jgi:alpha-beta hydrolase superfamily lysophospholipase
VSLSTGLQDRVVTPVRHAVYLHGFASSPASSKATWYGRELMRLGVGYACPDFNQPAFETLTVTRMIEQTLAAVEAAAAGPVALIGSSLGAYVAVLAAAAEASGRVDRLILLAPALDFGGNRLSRLGTHSIEEWREAGKLTVFHYGLGEPRDVGFGLYEDAAKHDAFDVMLDLPMLVVQGRRDPVVDPAMVQRWCATRPTAHLHLVDDEHQLSDTMPFIWAKSREWLGV